AERIAKIQDPLALMANSNNLFASPALHQDLSPLNHNFLQQPITNPTDITDPTTAMNMALALMAKAFKLNYSTPTNNNQRISSNPKNRQIAQPGMNMGQDKQMQMIRGNGRHQFRQYAGQNARNLNGYNEVQNVGNQVAQNPRVQNIGNQNGPRRRDAAYLQTQLLIAQKEVAGIQLQAEEYDLMAAAADLDEIKEVNANCILMANLQQASSSGTQTDSAPVYDSDGSAEVHENYDNNEIFNMFTQEEQYTELLEPIPEPQQVPQNDNNVISEVTNMEQDGEKVEQHSANFEETCALYESLYQNLAVEVEKVNSVNRKLKETNADLTTELARYKNQKRCFEISQEKYDKLERCYQKSVYQEQCLSKKINALHLSTAGSKSRPPMLNKENYVPWSSRLLRYAKSRPNGKLIHNSIINGPYVNRMIPEPGATNWEVPVNETFHIQTDDKLTEKELKQIEADDQAIQTILLGLPEDIYAAEKKAKLFNEWERFTSNEGESIESYYHRFLKLMIDLKRNKHFPEKIASNLKFLNNLQPEWSWHKEVDELKAERLAKTQDPLALMATSNNPYNFPVPHQDQPSFNQNYMQQPMSNPEDITDPTTAMNMALVLMAKAFKLNYSTPTNNNQRILSNPRNRQIAQPECKESEWESGCSECSSDLRVQNIGNQNGLIGFLGNANQNLNGNGNLVVARAEGNAVGHNGNQIRCYNCRGVGYFARNYTVRPRRRDAAYLQTQLLIAQKEEAGIQLQAKEFDLMAAAADHDEIEEVNANCILMANMQQASTSGTQTDKAPVYDSDGSAEVHDYGNCDDNAIFNVFTQEEQYTELLEPIPEQHQVPQNDNNVIFEVTSMEQSRETIK
nr:hypothetical protein [Tanacetum cinerariifolium]